MILTLTGIACALNGRVRGNKIVAPGPEAVSHKVRWKRKRYTLTVWINADGDIGVNSHTGQDPIATKDWVRARCGLPAWEPKKRKARPLPPLTERSQFLSESLRIARDRVRITFEQFALIANDLKNVCSDAMLDTRVHDYAREFGFDPDQVRAALRPEWRSYKADERATIFQITYDEYRRLGLHRSGCIEVDAAERRRRTKARQNAKRRADRTAKRVSKSANDRAPLRPPEKLGTVRVPSSEAVGLVRVEGECLRRDSEIECSHIEKSDSSIRQGPRARCLPTRKTIKGIRGDVQRWRPPRRGSKTRQSRQGNTGNGRNGQGPRRGGTADPSRNSHRRRRSVGPRFRGDGHPRSGLREATPGARTLLLGRGPTREADARNIGQRNSSGGTARRTLTLAVSMSVRRGRSGRP